MLLKCLFNKFNLLTCLLFLIETTAGFFDPIALIANGISAGSHLYDSAKSLTWCKLRECCDDHGIPADFTRLERTLKEKLYGQHLVSDSLINSLKGHWDPNYKARKALALTFHGWTGGGKNYVTSFIQDALYKKGVESSFILHFTARIDFPVEKRVAEYREKVYDRIKWQVLKCPRSIIVFDEVDHMPSGILDVIKPLIDYNAKIDGVDYREAIFIFLSNNGSPLITEKMVKLWRNGIVREKVKLSDFEQDIIDVTFNEAGGLFHSDNIKNSLIDVYIPFLPLEPKHVRMCVLDEFKRRGINYPREEHIDLVMETIEYGPEPDRLFSKTGCKRISQRVGLVSSKYY